MSIQTPNAQEMQRFCKAVLSYYQAHGRELPWRQPETDGSFDPYKILVSEIMLQQTQVSRVIPKYQQFLRALPDVTSLAQAQLASVLTLWSGLGYNRRAKYLQQAAQLIMSEYGGLFPQAQKELIKLPGVGVNTAGAVLAYSFNQPVVFIETNVRTVYLHHFFANQQEVDDRQLLPLLTATLDHTNPRVWYWALMDYGSYLKSVTTNPARRSRHHIKQSAFKGSKRQVRGQVLKALVDGSLTSTQLQEGIADDRLEVVLSELLKEKMISRKDTTYSLGG